MNPVDNGEARIVKRERCVYDDRHHAKADPTR